MRKDSNVMVQSGAVQDSRIGNGGEVIHQLNRDVNSRIQAGVIPLQSTGTNGREAEITDKHSTGLREVLSMIKQLVNKILTFGSESIVNREYYNYQEQRAFELESEKKRSWTNLLIF